MSGDIWACHNLGVGGVLLTFSWVETSDDAKHLTLHRTDPITKNYPAQNASSAKAEKCCTLLKKKQFLCYMQHVNI